MHTSRIYPLPLVPRHSAHRSQRASNDWNTFFTRYATSSGFAAPPLQSTSPSINTGDPELYDLDCTRSDMGAFGGPYQRKADSDNDGSPDDIDECPNDSFKFESGICGCGFPDADTDNNGIPDCNDN